MKFTAPTFKAKAFNCALCGAYSHMTWLPLQTQNGGTNYYESLCSCCNSPSLWRVKYFLNGKHREEKEPELIYPDHGHAPLPDDAMPENVKADYVEAARIFSKSPRGAAALLRLGLQKLCKHLGENGENINNDIRNLSAKNIVPPLVVNVADTVRITGNNAVHPGEMSDEDFDHIASKMFELLNFIVKKGISEPLELKALYELTPEGPRKDAEAKDAKAKQEKT